MLLAVSRHFSAPDMKGWAFSASVMPAKSVVDGHHVACGMFLAVLYCPAALHSKTRRHLAL